MKFSSLAALEVVKMTTSSAASDSNFVKMTTFSFQCTFIIRVWSISVWNSYCVMFRLVFTSERKWISHYDDVIMTMLASQITSLTVVYSIVYSGVNQRKHQSSASLAFVREIHRGPVNFPHKWPVTRKMFPFDDVIMHIIYLHNQLIM